MIKSHSAALRRKSGDRTVKAGKPGNSGKSGRGTGMVRIIGGRFRGRRLPVLDSEGLRKRLGIKAGGAIHLFGFRADFQDGTSGKYLLAAEPYNESM